MKIIIFLLFNLSINLAFGASKNLPNANQEKHKKAHFDVKQLSLKTCPDLRSCENALIIRLAHSSDFPYGNETFNNFGEELSKNKLLTEVG